MVIMHFVHLLGVTVKLFRLKKSVASLEKKLFRYHDVPREGVATGRFILSGLAMS